MLLRTTRFDMVTRGKEHGSGTPPITKCGAPVSQKFSGNLVHMCAQYEEQPPNFALTSK